MINGLQSFLNRKTRLQKTINENPDFDKLNEIYKMINKINLNHEKENYKNIIKKENIFNNNFKKLNNYLKENKIKDYWSTVLINSGLFPSDNNKYINYIKCINLNYLYDENNYLKNKNFEFFFKKNEIFSNKSIKVNLFFEREELEKIESESFIFINNNDNNINEIIFEEIPYRKNSNIKFYKKKIDHILFFNIFKNRQLDYSHSEEILDDFDSKKQFDNKDLTFIEVEEFFIKLENIMNRNFFYYKNYKKTKVEILNKKLFLNEAKFLNKSDIENESLKINNDNKENKNINFNSNSNCKLQ